MIIDEKYTMWVPFRDHDGHFGSLICSFEKQQEAQRATYRAPEYNVPLFLGIGQDGHFCLLIGTKNTTLVEDVEILLPVKFRWISFSGFKEVENVSVNQNPGWPSCFSDWPEKQKLGRGRWDLVSCQVLLNSLQRFSEEQSKMSQSIRG